MLYYGLYVLLLYHIRRRHFEQRCWYSDQSASPYASTHAYICLGPLQDGDHQLQRHRPYSRINLLKLKTIGESMSNVPSDMWKTLKSLKLTKAKIKRGSRAGRHIRRKIHVIQLHWQQTVSAVTSLHVQRKSVVKSNLSCNYINVAASNHDILNHVVPGPYCTPSFFLINARSLV